MPLHKSKSAKRSRRREKNCTGTIYIQQKNMEDSELTELIPSLPEELSLECLIRLPYTDYRIASRVCHRWRELLQSQKFYYDRKKFGYTHKVACLIQAVINGSDYSGGRKITGSPSYGLTVFDPVSQTWDRLPPVPKYPNGLPFFCQLVSCEGKVIVMGGWDPESYDPVRDVFVYDFATQQWRKGKEMPSKRSFFAIGADSGKVYVVGGHDEHKNALKSGWVYDSRRDEWSELTQMSEERDECEGLVIGDEFWVVSGYSTDNQGGFDGSADVYDFRTRKWKRVEEVWESGRCPRSSVGFNGRFVNWAELDSTVRVAVSGIKLDGRVMITGSEYQGGPPGFYMVEMKEGQNGDNKLKKIDIPHEFSGFVQSGCCVEI